MFGVERLKNVVV